MTRRRRVSAPLERAAAGPGGEAHRAAADALSQFAGRVGRMADAAAQREGALEGGRAGLDPEFRPRRDGTIRGAAYDEAGLRSMAVRVDATLRERLAESFDASNGDPLKFDALATALRAELVETSPVEIRPRLESGFQRMRFGYDRDFARAVDQAEADALGAEALSLLDGRIKDIGRSAYQGGLDGSADALLMGELEALTEELLSYGPKTAFAFQGDEIEADARRAGVLSLEQIQQTLIRAGETVGANRVKGAFQRIGGLAAKEAFLTEFRKDYAAGEGPAGDMSLDQVERLESEMAAEIRSLRAEQRSGAAALRSRVTEIRSNLREYRSYAADGLTPPPAELQRLEAEAVAAGDPALVSEVRQLGRLTSLAGEAARMHPVELRTEIDRRRVAAKGGASPQQAAEIGTLESVHTGMTAALNRDPYAYAVRSGLIEPVPFYPGEGLQLTLNGRAAQARLIEAAYGVKGAMFTAEEAAGFKAAEETGGAALIELATGISRATGEDAGFALERISDGAPLLAHLAGLTKSGGSVEAVQAAARGRELLAEKEGVASGLSATTTGETARAVLDGALAHHGSARRDIEAAANAIYIGRVGLNADFDREAYGRAVQEAAGAVYVGGEQFGGVASIGEGWFDGRGSSQIVLPSWLRADHAAEAFATLSLEDYTNASVGGGGPLHGDGTPVDLATLKQARLQTVGPGRYRLSLNDPMGEDPRFLRGTGASGFYELELDKARDVIARETPEAVMK